MGQGIDGEVTGCRIRRRSQRRKAERIDIVIGAGSASLLAMNIRGIGHMMEVTPQRYRCTRNVMWLCVKPHGKREDGTNGRQVWTGLRYLALAEGAGYGATAAAVIGVVVRKLILNF